MNTEDDFHALLDSDVTDYQTRAVLADWLEERGDGRAAGYRVLAGLNRYPRKIAKWSTWYNEERFGVSWSGSDWTLPADWFSLLKEGVARENLDTTVYSLDYTSRREAEDAAAEAFAMLPDWRREELSSSLVL